MGTRRIDLAKWFKDRLGADVIEVEMHSNYSVLRFNEAQLEYIAEHGCMPMTQTSTRELAVRLAMTGN